MLQAGKCCKKLRRHTTATGWQASSDSNRAQILHGLLQAGRGCKKLGRPITWDGDPEDPNLPESDRKKIRRRVKNRESARRVQQRRKAAAEDLQHQVGLFHFGGSCRTQGAAKQLASRGMGQLLRACCSRCG